jgi:RNase P subunit RPR2
MKTRYFRSKSVEHIEHIRTFKRSATNRFRSAVRLGKLIRPYACERCDTIPEPDHQGRSTIHGHHNDYTKPLEVVWLCKSCHRDEHMKIPTI